MDADLERWLDYAKWKCEECERERGHGLSLIIAATVLAGFLLSAIIGLGVALVQGYMGAVLSVGTSFVAVFLFAKGWKKMRAEEGKRRSYVKVVDQIMREEIEDVATVRERLDVSKMGT